jgi:peptidoglycan/xylan/chitin deacetylase (PgdA/CDA1 family)
VESPHTKCTVILSFDFDAESMWTSLGLTTPTPLSRGEYGARVAVPRILALLADYDVPATFFVPADTIRRHKEIVTAIHEKGHEIGHHGDCHESPAGLGIEEEQRVLETGIREIENAVGERPKGYRSPAWDLSPNSVTLFQECGFLYDSSMMGDDFTPYLLTQNNVKTNIVEIPVSWELDDAPHFLFNFVPYLVGMAAPSKVFEIWSAEFEGAYANNGVLTLTMHPQIIGRYHRLKMLEALIAHIKTFSGIRFATCADVAHEWVSR